MKNDDDRSPAVVRLLMLLLVLLSLGALAGGGALMVAPDGHLLKMPISMLKYSPFRNFLMPGAILFSLDGIFPMAVAYALWKRPRWRRPEALNPFKRVHWSWAASLAAGVILIVWITVEVALLRSVAFLHILYFGWGLLIIVLTAIRGVRRDCALLDPRE